MVYDYTGYGYLGENCKEPNRFLLFKNIIMFMVCLFHTWLCIYKEVLPSVCSQHLTGQFV